ncbi:MAG: DUF3574 domain-containing protein [Hyphomicrobiaceae bacterium]
MSIQRWPSAWIAISIVLAAAGAAALWDSRVGGARSAGVCARGDAALRRVELVFGFSRKGRVDVGEAEWSDFLAREVTPRFPDGLTVLPASGQWRTRAGNIVQEPARLLLVWAAAAPDLDERVEQIRAAWKREQKQDSVLRAYGTDCVSF